MSCKLWCWIMVPVSTAKDMHMDAKCVAGNELMKDDIFLNLVI